MRREGKERENKKEEEKVKEKQIKEKEMTKAIKEMRRRGEKAGENEEFKVLSLNRQNKAKQF